MYLWFTYFLLNQGQCLRVTAPCLAAAFSSPGKGWDSVWAIQFSRTSSNRDWPPNSTLPLCSWNNWQLLEEAIFHIYPVIHVPLSADKDLKPVSTESNILPGCMHTGLCCVVSKTSGRAGTGKPTGKTHTSITATQAWSWGPRHKQKSRRITCTAAEATIPFFMPVSGWILLAWLAGALRKAAFRPILSRHPNWVLSHYRSEDTICTHAECWLGQLSGPVSIQTQ